jgi:hypothetical protein
VKTGFLVAFVACACTCLGQDRRSFTKFIEGHPVPYCNMHIIEEEGDVVGWDLRVTKVSDGYRLTLFCGEGEIQGPIRATFHLKNGIAVIHPNDKSCGERVELRFEAADVLIKAGDGDFESVPQHRNFIKEERWK